MSEKEKKEINIPEMTPEAWELIQWRTQAKVRNIMWIYLAGVVTILSVGGLFVLNTLVEKQVKDKAAEIEEEQKKLIKLHSSIFDFNTKFQNRVLLAQHFANKEKTKFVHQFAKDYMDDELTMSDINNFFAVSQQEGYKSHITYQNMLKLVPDDYHPYDDSFSSLLYFPWHTLMESVHVYCMSIAMNGTIGTNNSQFIIDETYFDKLEQIYNAYAFQFKEAQDSLIVKFSGDIEKLDYRNGYYRIDTTKSIYSKGSVFEHDVSFLKR